MTRGFVFLQRLAVGGVLLSGPLGIGASAASAGESEAISTERGRVAFSDRGEILEAYAGPYAGGYGVRAYLTWNDGGGHTARVTALQGADGTGSATRNLSIREGVTVYLRMCYSDIQGDNVKCSKRQRAEA
jgi:hypothetical protein